MATTHGSGARSRDGGLLPEGRIVPVWVGMKARPESDPRARTQRGANDIIQAAMAPATSATP